MTSTELKHQANLQRWSQAIRKRNLSGCIGKRRIYPRIKVNVASTRV